MIATETLIEAAAAAARAARWDEAKNLWRDVLRRDPRNAKALFSFGVHALREGDLHAAEESLAQAHHGAPDDPIILHTLGVVRARRGDAAGELQAIEASLAADAYFLPGLLAKAGWLERAGDARAAAEVFANALKVAPPPEHWPDALRAQLDHAAAFVARNADAYWTYLTERLAPLQQNLPPREAERWREAAAILAGRTKPSLSASNQLAVPRLPSIPFFDRADFSWVAALEAKTEAIREELAASLAAARDVFEPYIAYKPGDPVNQWASLNHSRAWSAFHLWRNGAPVEENQRRCPRTTQALREIEMARIGGLCPNAMFSMLAPRTHIPPHHGETNARLVAHLPLIVPEGCRYRVGFEHRQWRVGETLIFDDTIEHEAYNDGDESRVVLIFDLWNPLLSPAERAMVQAMTQAARDFPGLRKI